VLEDPRSRWSTRQRGSDLCDEDAGPLGDARLAEGEGVYPSDHGNDWGVHASPNVTKNVLDWEYTTEILHSDLRTHLRGQLQASPPRSVLSHEGSCPKVPGALHVQSFPSEEAASGGQSHV
jgi:hypothetical protein